MGGNFRNHGALPALAGGRGVLAALSLFFCAVALPLCIPGASLADSIQWKPQGNDQGLRVLDVANFPTDPLAKLGTPGRGWTDPVTGMEFVWVPGGCYRMGSGSGKPDEGPIHEVCVDGFWMGKYEVTQAQWRKIMGKNPSRFKGDRNPVERVSWNDIQEFLKRLNGKGKEAFRLPSEAEWEYAARSGGRDEQFSGGNDLDRVAWYDANSSRGTNPVGGKAPNAFGLYDMSGNVMEWCWDRYDPKAYSRHARMNPLVTGDRNSARVARGGCWGTGAEVAKPTFRMAGEPNGTYMITGFRLVRPE